MMTAAHLQPVYDDCHSFLEYLLSIGTIRGALRVTISRRYVRWLGVQRAERFCHGSLPPLELPTICRIPQCRTESVRIKRQLLRPIAWLKPFPVEPLSTQIQIRAYSWEDLRLPSSTFSIGGPKSSLGLVRTVSSAGQSLITTFSDKSKGKQMC